MTINILLLEDTAADAELIERQLRRDGLDVHLRRVTSESSFRRELIASHYDVILADYNLPGFDGITAMRIAGELTPNIPFIFVSGSIGEERAIIALREGAADYILKDHLPRLTPVVRRALEDVRDRISTRRMQQALIRSEQRFYYAARATRDVIWEIDLRSGRIWIGESMADVWGYELEDPEVHHDWWLTKIHPDDLAGFVASHEAALTGAGDLWSHEYRFRRANGEYGYVHDRGVIIRGGGAPVRMVGAMQDVTEQNAAEERAADAEHLAKLGHWSWDFTTATGTWSRGSYRILGLPVGRPLTLEEFAAVIDPADRAAIFTLPKEDVVEHECRVRRADDGAERIVRARVRWIREHGFPLRALGTLQDVTERLEAERRIRELSRINHLTLTNAAEGILAIGADRRVLFANPSALRTLRWESDGDHQPRDAHAALHAHGAAAECPIERALRGEGSTGVEEEFLRSGGEGFSVRYACSPIEEDGGVSGCVIVFDDITERQHLERQLEQARRVSGLGRIAATIAHEFNNVLMGIQPFVELIRRRAGDDERQQQAAAHILNAVGRGRRITADILRTTQISQAVPQTVEVAAWLKQLEPQIRALAEELEVKVESADDPLYGSFDPSQIQQVITNLAANARDAMAGAGKLTITAHDGNAVHVEVGDTGGGIAPEVLPHIFEPLFTTKRSGTGLGLAVAQQLVERNRGSISVRSTPGEGTTFIIVLPRATPAAALRRLLLVTDDLTVGASMQALLEAKGLDVRVANGAVEAEKTIGEFRPDALVIDIGVRAADRLRLYREVSARLPELPTVLCVDDPAEIPARPRESMVRIVKKPCDADMLLATIGEMT